jgi:hypothetical protein
VSECAPSLRSRHPGQSTASVFTNERRIAGGSPGGEIALGASDGIALMSCSPSRPVKASSLVNAASFRVSTVTARSGLSLNSADGGLPSRLRNERRSVRLARATLAR